MHVSHHGRERPVVDAGKRGALHQRAEHIGAVDDAGTQNRDQGR
jgi:hypothetical protein